MRKTTVLVAFVLGLVLGGVMFSQVQTSAQEAAPSRADRLLRAEERQASALEDIHSELRSLRTDLRRAR